MSGSILNISTVAQRTTLSRSSIYRKIAAGEFPEPIKLSGRRVGWVAEEVDKWIEARLMDRDLDGL